MSQPILTDRDVAAMFAARAAGTVNPDLAQRIHEAAAGTRQRRRLFGFAGLDAGPMRAFAFATLLGATSLALVGALILGGQQQPQPTVVPPGPTASPSPTATPSPSPSPSSPPSPSATPLPPGTRTSPDTLERPRVDGVGWIAVPATSLFAAPSETADVLGELPSVATDLFFLEGPVEAEGFVWWKVQPYALDEPEAPTYPIGWVIAGVVNSDEPPVLGYVPDCPTSPIDVERSLRLSSYAAIACFGRDDVVLEGTLSCSEADVDRLVSGPDWLRNDRSCQFQTEAGFPLIEVHGAAVHDLVTPGQVVTTRVRVTAHVDDAQAASCVAGGAEGGRTPEQAVLDCRKLLVATAVERLD